MCEGERGLQAELARRRDADVTKLQRDLEDAHLQHETMLASFRKKHQDAVNQLAEQIDQLHRVKQRSAPNSHVVI